MKKWIAQQWIALAEVFGWRIPAWVRGMVPQDEFEAMLAREHRLTETLKEDSPEAPPMPAFLSTRIERAIQEAEKPAAGRNLIGSFLIPASAFAMAVLVGLFVVNSRDLEQPGTIDTPVVAVAEPAPATEVPLNLSRISERISNLENGLIMQPLENEQERLAADLTSALQFMSSSILPDNYAADVNSRLDTLRSGRGNSI